MTERLDLTPVATADTDELYALHSDPRVWTHFPSGRHTDRSRIIDVVATSTQRWATDGLGYWTARLRVPVNDLVPGDLAGIGGCQRRPGAGWWNLYYRFRPEAQGAGLAAELARAAVAAARVASPGHPVIAYLLEHNAGSAHTARNAGLHLVSRGPDAGNPDPDAVRLVYADRPVSDALLAEVLAHT